jgi:hypothetical protein
VTPAVDFELDTFQLVLLRPGPAAGTLDPETVRRLQAGHIEHNLRLKAAGQLAVAGAVAGMESLVGLGLSRLPADKLAALTAADPGVQAGLYTVELAQYLCPKGTIAFPDPE